jgi:hypothetical protein
MDPVDNASRWSRWAVSGPESTISQVFSVLDTKRQVPPRNRTAPFSILP